LNFYPIFLFHYYQFNLYLRIADCLLWIQISKQIQNHYQSVTILKKAQLILVNFIFNLILTSQQFSNLFISIKDFYLHSHFFWIKYLHFFISLMSQNHSILELIKLYLHLDYYFFNLNLNFDLIEQYHLLRFKIYLQSLIKHYSYYCFYLTQSLSMFLLIANYFHHFIPMT
jgi:hypothetical protein